MGARAIAARDPFGDVAGDYAAHRPTYPDALFRYLAMLAPSTGCAVDVAAGSGQATLGLAQHLARVIAIDLSARQLAAMSPDARVTRVVAHAEALPIRSGAVDLVVAAQALHWFDEAAFLHEVERVLRPRGIVAAVAYGLSIISPVIDRAVRELHDGVLAADWAIDRRAVLSGYATSRFPGRPLGTPTFLITRDWQVNDYLGYLSTWSAVTAHRTRTGIDPLDAFGETLRGLWGHETRTVRWSVRLRASRV